jgi:hypothetical protein
MHFSLNEVTEATEGDEDRQTLRDGDELDMDAPMAVRYGFEKKRFL